MKRCLDYLVYVLVRIVMAVVQAVPMSVCQRLADPLAGLCCALGVRHSVIEDNLRHAFPDMPEPERRRIERAHWRHLVLMIFEMAHADRLTRDTNWRRYVKLNEMRPMVRLFLTTRPSVVVAGHFGNFEISARMLGLFGFSTFVVARPLDNPYLNRWLNRFRGRFGQFILPKRGSANEADARLAAGGVLAVLGDQSAGPKGCFVEFFGRPASTHKAIAVMALAHEAPLMVTYARRSGEPLKFEIGCTAIADPRENGPETAGVRELTQWYSRQLEAIVRRDPEQYWWVHRRWKDQPKKKAGGGRNTPSCAAPSRSLKPAASSLIMWIRIANVADCPPGSALEAMAGDRVVALFNVDGQFYALDGVCPHQGGPLGEGAMCGAVITCPWHGWQFDVRTGQQQIHPQIVQPGFDVRVEGTDVYVRPRVS